MNKIAIFDIDGTLCAISPERQKCIDAKNWDEFHRLAEFESVNEPVKQLLWQHIKDSIIIISTGRPEQYYEMTALWLAQNHILYHYLFMRRRDDFRHSYDVKTEIAKVYPRGTERIAVEDRQQDIDMYLAEKLKAHQRPDRRLREIAPEVKIARNLQNFRIKVLLHL